MNIAGFINVAGPMNTTDIISMMLILTLAIRILGLRFWNRANKIILAFPGENSTIRSPGWWSKGSLWGKWNRDRNTVTAKVNGKTYTTGWNNVLIEHTPLARERNIIWNPQEYRSKSALAC